MTDVEERNAVIMMWYEAGKADRLNALRPYLAHTDDCDTRKGVPLGDDALPCCCGLAEILEANP